MFYCLYSFYIPFVLLNVQYYIWYIFTISKNIFKIHTHVYKFVCVQIILILLSFIRKITKSQKPKETSFRARAVYTCCTYGYVPYHIYQIFKISKNEHFSLFCDFSVFSVFFKKSIFVIARFTI